MLNTSILKLTLLNISLSPFSRTHFSSYCQFTVDRSFFSNSYNTLFYFHNLAGQNKFSKTIFHNILNRAILADGSIDYSYNSTVITNRLSPLISSSCTFTFVNCMFRNCSIRGETVHGGAVSIHVSPSDLYDVDLSFTKTSFYNCNTAGGHGGAIYGFRLGDLSLDRTCFNNCCTQESSATGDTGMGQACFIWHRTTSDHSKAIFSSLSACPDSLAVRNTESVLSIFSGHVDIDDCNFTNNWVDKVASAICLTEQKLCNIYFTNCINCTGESTMHIGGFEDKGTESCDINNINFINCRNTSASSKYGGVLVGYYTTITVEDCVFIMKGNKYLVASSYEYDLVTSLTFSRCIFDMPLDDLIDKTRCSFQADCKYDASPATNTLQNFNSKECWEIYSDTSKSENPLVYSFFVVFAFFAAIVGFGLYLQISTSFGDATALTATSYM